MIFSAAELSGKSYKEIVTLYSGEGPQVSVCVCLLAGGRGGGGVGGGGGDPLSQGASAQLVWPPSQEQGVVEAASVSASEREASVSKRVR